MTPPESMMRALEPLHLLDRVTPKTEWTMEANPSSVDPVRMRGYRELGVNRVSMGVQALRDDLLANLGRVHSRERALQAIPEILDAGITNVSVDLLCGVPGQSEADLVSAIDTLTRLGISHLSCYLLTLTPTHRMYSQLPDEDTQLQHLLIIDREMTARGFEHYEISNFARPGMRARHNLAYWTGASYLGFGPSAHSFDAGSGSDLSPKRRWKNMSSLHAYARALHEGRDITEQHETLTEEQQELEKWMLALRLSDGAPLDWITTPLQHARMERLETEGYLKRGDQRFWLTARGFAISDTIVGQLVAV